MTENRTLFQHNTLASLMAGLYHGTMSIFDLLEKGNLGIGTVDGIDGELIILDGKAYQAIGTGEKAEVISLNGTETVPYAAIINHHNDINFDITKSISDSELKEMMEAKFISANLFQSIKIHGQFDQMHVRMIPKSPIGKSFAEIASNQPEFIEENISGSLVGFWTPELFHGVSVAGYHLHFLSDDLKFGGHVMDFQMAKGQVEIGYAEHLLQDFPSQNEAFQKAKFDVEALKEDIRKSE
ncbi:acetolactate decarboxylase [Streptococcus parauberis]|uniref:Alpha-acetolactate decarboxylase n=1 Tax=Streptococcus parauberis TaxID=1348 RepID=A0A0E2UB52_9STRE|nr:acetolactate decarboxylase [Streptococcus parauberis]AEF25412.1 alpha-acetolactate decarboxylase [Streptococcus parauberis KCTC 11537]EMF50068.1 Alpha-acetolactate decarboxylase [Streptococcus parauberis KRS-02109]KYP20921.1 Alpha-acetolactate decarboxylase [Streptococcus parauberis]KYP21305.1 Alpha-acetolactate decarboxylase [Streptococcus parauberis]KYP22299.1 Alpha-acetolactate decarboxylase [Streptococcus parauberis]